MLTKGGDRQGRLEMYRVVRTIPCKASNTSFPETECLRGGHMKASAKVSLSSVLGAALTLAIAPAAHGQTAKSGTYSGWFGWHSVGQVTQLEGGDLYWIGQFNGAFRNDAGSGFMHNSSVICPGVTSVIGGGQYLQGNCILTDQDGDKAITIWNCQMNAQGRCPG